MARALQPPRDMAAGNSEEGGSWKRWIVQAERRFDRWKRRLAKRIRGGTERPALVPYRGWGTRREIEIRGRVLADHPPRLSRHQGLTWRNLWRTWRRFETDEVPDVRVEARVGPLRGVATTGEEGYFTIRLRSPRGEGFPAGWHPVELRLQGPWRPEVRARGEVRVSGPGARLGVISDLDDTVLHTDATDLVKMVRNVALGSARSRMPFAGVARFYRALAASTTGTADASEGNPLFYVSSSPWNLYDLLAEFLRLHEIPAGPLFLRDWGIRETEFLPTGHSDHKLAAIRRILDLHPDLPFLLVGDSGQEDPEIYHRVVAEYPDRIPALYIRNVNPTDPERPRAVARLAQEVAAQGSELLLVETTLEAARHALSRGWIDAEAATAVAWEVQRDLAPATEPSADLVDEDEDR